MQDDPSPGAAAAATDTFTGEQSKESTRVLEAENKFPFPPGGLISFPRLENTAL